MQKLSTKENKIVFEYSVSYAFCSIIRDQAGNYLNQAPILIRNWDTIGVSEYEGQRKMDKKTSRKNHSN